MMALDIHPSKDSILPNLTILKAKTHYILHTPLQLTIMPTDVNLIYDYQVITQSRSKGGLMGKAPANAVTWDKTRDLAYEYLYTHLTASSCDTIDGSGRKIHVQCMSPRASSR